MEKLDPEKAADIIEEMRPDEAADLLATLSPEASEEIIEEMPKREAAEVKELLRFEADTAGGMMNTEFVTVAEDATRGEVVDYIRFHEVPLDQLDNIALVNRDAVLTGTVRLGQAAARRFGTARLGAHLGIAGFCASGREKPRGLRSVR